MGFIVCPFCKVHIQESAFPTSGRKQGRVVMLCPNCKRRLAFTLLGEKQEPCREPSSDMEGNSVPKRHAGARLEVVENRFVYKATFPLSEGENRIGRYNDKHTDLEVAIHTTDPSMDRIHCTLFAEPEGDGFTYYVEDNNSLTGTFVNTKEVEQGEHRKLSHGDVLTLGATTLLFILEP